MTKKLLFSIVAGILISLACCPSALTEDEAKDGYVGAAIGLGPIFWTAPELKYKNTSIGDIEFPCRTTGAALSIMFFFQRELSPKHRTLFLWEFNGSWIHEKGTKRWPLQGYPAIAQSEMKGFLLEGGFVLHYLRVGRIWVGSGLQLGLGGIDEAFRIDLQRNGQDIVAFDPDSKTRFATRSNYILLAATVLEGFWGLWDLHFGHSDVDARRFNEFGGFRDRWPRTKTHTSGWYVRIRKVFPLNLDRKRIAGAKRETG